MKPKETLKPPMKVCIVKYLWGVAHVLRVQENFPASHVTVTLNEFPVMSYAYQI